MSPRVPGSDGNERILRIWPIQFSSIWPIRCYHSVPERSWKRWQWKNTLHSPKLQHYWSLTIRLFSVISRTLVVGRGLTPLLRCSLSQLGSIFWISTLRIKINSGFWKQQNNWTPTMATRILTGVIPFLGGAHGVMGIVVGNGHGDMSSNPEWDW